MRVSLPANLSARSFPFALACAMQNTYRSFRRWRLTVSSGPDQSDQSVLMGTASGQSAVDRQFAVSVLMGTASGQSTVARINLFALSVLMGTASGQSALSGSICSIPAVPQTRA